MSSAPAYFARLTDCLEEVTTPHVMLPGQLDGFVTGLALSPSMPAIDDWVDRVWGGPAENLADPALKRAISDLVREHFETVSASLYEGSYAPTFDAAEEGPVVWQTWCLGFMQAVSIEPEAWDAVEEDDAFFEPYTALLMIVHQALDHLGKERAPAASDDVVADLIAECAQQMMDARLGLLEGDDLPPLVPPDELTYRAGPKPGRNDPCPCGSSRKYKKCCGAG